MPLPKVDVITFPLVIPSTKKTVLFRPYSVKEEKLLLMAQETDEKSREDVMTSAIHTLIRNCSLGAVDPVKLPWFDLEYLLVQLRAHSVGSDVTVVFTCQKTANGVVCGQSVPLSFNLTDVKIQVSNGHTNKIELRPDIGVVMKYPRLEDLMSFFPPQTEDAPFHISESAFNFIVHSVESIYTATEIFDVADYTTVDVQDFLEQFQVHEFQKIYDFYATLPRLAHTLQFECPKCGNKGPIVLRGIRDFLVLSSTMTT